MKIRLMILIAALGAIACNSGRSSDSESVSDSIADAIETAISQAGSESGATEGGSVSLVHPASVCSYTSNLTCSGDTGTVTWGGCSVNSITMTGSWTQSYSSGCCAANLATGCSVTRTSSASVATLISGESLTTSTTAHTAYDGTSIPGTGTTISNSAGTRTIIINGLHRVLKGPKGTTWFDHSIVTGTPLTVTGSRTTGNRTITAGSVTLYHNRAKYTATTTFSNVKWGTPSCCFPTSGSVSTALSGSLSGTLAMTFSTTCGEASFTDSDGVTSTITLNSYQCQ